MKYSVQGWNGIICEWETLSYWDKGLKKKHEYPSESLAVSAMTTYLLNDNDKAGNYRVKVGDTSDESESDTDYWDAINVVSRFLQ